MSSSLTKTPDRYAERFQVAGLHGCLVTDDEQFARSFKEVFFDAAPDTGQVHVTYIVFVDRGTSQKKHRVLRNGEFLLLTATYRSLLPSLELDISRTLIETFPERRHLRASLVSVDGVGVLIVEEEGAAGGWLVKALIEKGAQFHSNGMTILNYPEPTATPYVKGIGLASPASPLASQAAKSRQVRERAGNFIRYHRPESMLRGCPNDHQAIHCIIVPSPDRADPPRLDPMPKADALQWLMKSTYGVESWDSDTLSYLVDLAEQARCYSLLRGISGATVELIILMATEISRSQLQRCLPNV
jgi:hypothetical protein